METIELAHVQPFAPQPIDEGLFRQIVAGLFHQVTVAGGDVARPVGRAGVFQNAADLRVGQVELEQAVHHADRLGIALEVAEILTDPAAQPVQIALPLMQAQRRHWQRSWLPGSLPQLAGSSRWANQSLIADSPK